MKPCALKDVSSLAPDFTWENTVETYLGWRLPLRKSKQKKKARPQLIWYAWWVTSCRHVAEKEHVRFTPLQPQTSVPQRTPQHFTSSCRRMIEFISVLSKSCRNIGEILILNIWSSFGTHFPTFITTRVPAAYSELIWHYGTRDLTFNSHNTTKLI